MTQQSILINYNSTNQLDSKSVPSAGMRGGLGRTLLTALLLLSIVPLGLISLVAATRGRDNLQRELEEKLNAVAVLTESQIHSWVDHQQFILTLLSNDIQIGSSASNSAAPQAADLSASNADTSLSSFSVNPTQTLDPEEQELTQNSAAPQFYEEIAEIQTKNPAFTTLILLDQKGQVLAAHPPISEGFIPDLFKARQMWLEASTPTLMLSQPVAESGLTLVALLDPHSLVQVASPPPPWDENVETYLVLPSGRAIGLRADEGANSEGQSAKRYSPAIEAALSGQSDATGYQNYQGVSVIGAYRRISDLDIALLVEQQRDVALAPSDDMAAVLIGAALAAALFTALIATAVTRRITLPIVQLTATAVQIAAGDLHQKVPATRRDEIGILARAFNVMTTKLRVLYEDLEQKVRERTHQLREANAQLSYQAMQLAISAEVARVVTSILDRERLLSRVVELIHDCFQAYFVAVFFIDDDGEWAVLREGSGGLGHRLKEQNYQADLRQKTLVSQAANNLKPYVCSGAKLDNRTDRDVFPHTCAELVVPLRIGERRIGVLDVHSIHEDAFAGDEMMILEILAGQVAVAIENARVYERELQAVDQLREMEESRRRFLSNMSRELRMPLNNIIGFSRVMLKEIDGPITERQREDLNAIYESGGQLLALINDILDIAQIEAGAMELAMHPVDLGEIVQSVIPTINALLQGRPIELHYELTSDLPLVLADSFRLRQVLIKLLSNAARFTQEGEISVGAQSDDQQVSITIHNTGIGVTNTYRKKVFDLFQQLSKPGAITQSTGLGLRFSKEIIEMHKGKIWLENETGITYIIALPIAASADNIHQDTQQ
jgi:signal transduction histidine kinase